MIDQAVYFMEEISQYPQSSLITFCKHIRPNSKTGYRNDVALFRKLFALRILQFNLEISYLELKLSDIHASNLLQNENRSMQLINSVYILNSTQYRILKFLPQYTVWISIDREMHSLNSFYPRNFKLSQMIKA